MSEQAGLRPCPNCEHVPVEVEQGADLTLVDCPECDPVWIVWDAVEQVEQVEQVEGER